MNVRVEPDQRPLHARVRVIARRFDAIASGARKLAGQALQNAENHEREARWLHDAADQLERLK